MPVKYTATFLVVKQNILVQKHAREIYSDFFGCKNEKIHLKKKLIVFLLLLKTVIVSTHYKRFIEAVLVLH